MGQHRMADTSRKLMVFQYLICVVWPTIFQMTALVSQGWLVEGDETLGLIGIQRADSYFWGLKDAKGNSILSENKTVEVFEIHTSTNVPATVKKLTCLHRQQNGWQSDTKFHILVCFVYGCIWFIYCRLHVNVGTWHFFFWFVRLCC